MVNVLVTGGAGFIGSHVCEALLSRGDFVVCVDNFSDYYDIRKKEDNISECLKNNNFKLYRTDILDFGSLNNIFNDNKINKIIHLAACVGVRNSIENPHLYYEVNVKGTLNLLELARNYRIKNFVFASSSSVFGLSEKIPFSEEHKTDKPISPYAATKKAGELLCHTYHHLHNIPITCLRFFTVYGPRNRPDMAVYKFVDAIANNKPITVFGDGSSQRDYTYVDDTIAGIVAALDKNLSFEIINLGNSKAIELRKLIAVIETALDKKAKIIYENEQLGDVPITNADIKKANELLSYAPETSIERGIAKVVEWYKGVGNDRTINSDSSV